MTMSKTKKIGSFWKEHIGRKVIIVIKLNKLKKKTQTRGTLQ